MDTGKSVPESYATLLVQQRQLLRGKRSVQMFPTGTPELDLPEGMQRHQNKRGVFHFCPSKITAQEIEGYSSRGSENKFLNLGPYDKQEIALRHLSGEKLIFVTEYTPEGVEVRSALGTDRTARTQRDYFEQTKEPESVIVVGDPPPRVIEFLKKG